MCWKIIIVAVLAGAINCVARDMDAVRPVSDPSGFRAGTTPEELSSRENGAQSFEEPTGIINLGQALAMALMKNPGLKVFELEIRTKEALVLQSSVISNPEVEFNTQNFGGLGRPENYEGSETTIQLRQLIELGGKRQARKEVAALNRDLTQWNYESKKIDLFIDTTKAFWALLAVQRRLELLDDIIHLSEETFHTVSERVRAGKVSPVEEIRAEILLSANRIEKERALRTLEAARYHLASFWDSTSPLFAGVQGDLERVLPGIPSIEKLKLLVPQNPDIARWATELESRQAAIELERANIVPNLTVTGGYQRLNNMGDQAFTLGLSVPLPIFNRNKGNVLAAQNRLVLAQNQRRASLVQVKSDLVQNYQRLQSSYQEVTALKENIMPSALKVYEAIREGYSQGKFDYLNVLDAQTTLSQAEIQLIDALFNYHRTVADIERLIGGSMESVLEIPEVDAGGE